MPIVDPVKRATRWLIGPLLAGCSASPPAPAPQPTPVAAPPAV
ncbi:energy transducer TonB, partial [Pelomonas sp. HMWF004]